MAVFSNLKTNTRTYYTTKDYAQGTDINGYYLRQEDDEFVCAKSSLELISKSFKDSKPNFIYYVRYDNGKIFDHRTLYSLSENQPSFINKVCKNDLRWIKVEAASFRAYLDFLKLESDQHYKAASRLCLGV